MRRGRLDPKAGVHRILGAAFVARLFHLVGKLAEAVEILGARGRHRRLDLGIGESRRGQIFELGPQQVDLRAGGGVVRQVVGGDRRSRRDRGGDVGAFVTGDIMHAPTDFLNHSQCGEFRIGVGLGVKRGEPHVERGVHRGGDRRDEGLAQILVAPVARLDDRPVGLGADVVRLGECRGQGGEQCIAIGKNQLLKRGEAGLVILAHRFAPGLDFALGPIVDRVGGL